MNTCLMSAMTRDVCAAMLASFSPHSLFILTDFLWKFLPFWQGMSSISFEVSQRFGEVEKGTALSAPNLFHFGVILDYSRDEMRREEGMWEAMWLEIAVTTDNLEAGRWKTGTPRCLLQLSVIPAISMGLLDSNSEKAVAGWVLCVPNHNQWGWREALCPLTQPEG